MASATTLLDLLRDRAGFDDALMNWSLRIERSVTTPAHRGHGQHCPSVAGTGPHGREGARGLGGAERAAPGRGTPIATLLAHVGYGAIVGGFASIAG